MASLPLTSALHSHRWSPRQLFGLLLLILFGVCWQTSRFYQRPYSSKINLIKPLIKPFRPTLPGPQFPIRTSTSGPIITAPHPIDTLIERAENAFTSLLAKETNDLPSAARAYRQARGRHPPPGFDSWYRFATDRNAIFVEDFWDQIYHDLGPFWALPPDTIRTDAKAFHMAVDIRNGSARSNTGWFWHTIWADLINTVSQDLPDMVVPLNPMDEPRLLVQWEDIGRYIEVERGSRSLTSSEETLNNVRGWGRDTAEENVTPTDVDWKNLTPHSLARHACHPDSEIRKVSSIWESAQSAHLIHEAGPPSKHGRAGIDFEATHMYGGFVANYSLSSDICHQPDLGSLHGGLIQPLTASTSQKLIPLFGGSKFALSNDIILPAPIYWTDDERFSSGTDSGIPWREKRPNAIWRGTATGGRNTPTNWKHFHRHRFVALTNGTKARLANPYSDSFFTPWLRLKAINNLRLPIRVRFGDWLTHVADTAFTDLMCDVGEVNGTCWYTSEDFAVTPGIRLQKQFDHKYLPDIDGNSFSGRYRAFLLSSSLPIKASLYREWHDSRLVAWKHFVPMDNRFGDFYGIMEYFRGFEGLAGGEGAVKGHDAAAEKIAKDGREWANMVLRRADMQIYVLRLLLEYARVADDRRNKLGFVGDLVQEGNQPGR